MKLIFSAVFLIILLINPVSAQDSLVYSMKELERKAGNCSAVNPEADSNCSRVTFSYPLISGSARGKISPVVIQKIKADLDVEVHTGIEAIANSPQLAADTYLADLENIRSEFNEGWNFNYERYISIIYNRNLFLTIGINEGGYAGGAHPNYMFSCKNYSLTSGKEIFLADVFDDSRMDEMLKQAETVFRKEMEIPKKTSLEDAGFWFKNNKFHLGDNFYLTDKGIEVVYNPYEVSAYALGTIIISLPHKTFSKYYSSWGPLKPYASEQ